jgi:hypothetical protein
MMDLGFPRRDGRLELICANLGSMASLPIGNSASKNGPILAASQY